MKFDGIRRGVGDVIVLPGPVTKMREAEAAERVHATLGVKLKSESRRRAKLALPEFGALVAEAEKALNIAQRDLDNARGELVRAKALVDGDGTP